MEDQKLENLLNLALSVTEEERRRSLSLNVGYDEADNLWDVIIKYTGEPEALMEEGIQVQPLLGNYAIVTLPQGRVTSFSAKPQVIYMEKPKRLFFLTSQGISASCIRPVQSPPYGLSGRGVLVGVVDSGVDYRHPDFCNEDGTTRILKIWDQTQTGGTPPEGYTVGAEYTSEQINEALRLTPEEGRLVVPVRDFSGHGTQVLGVAAGNGRVSGGVQRGVAYESQLLVVKLGLPRENAFPRTTELMLGVDYLVRESIRLGKPIVINISFGNNYGSHRGDNLLETYLDAAANMGRTVICVGTGNNGVLPLHTSGRLGTGERQEIQAVISEYERSLNLQLWKSYSDEMSISIEHPSGERLGPVTEKLGPQRYRLGNTELLLYYGKPSPFMVSQEVYLDLIPVQTYVDPGTWRLFLEGRSVKNGSYDLWLPGGGVLNAGTGFSFPTPDTTITIPSTARNVISVGAYDSRLQSYADFSGRGYGDGPRNVKPDLVAPGVDITTTFPGGGYGRVSGTSFATPFVSGSAALLMEWGIIRGNDPFLYGEKVKAYLRRGARLLPGYTVYPNAEIGYGEDVIIRLH